MRTSGIICEYNPLHNGHVYQIKCTRQLIGSDAGIVCAMSGNFVQRGDFAIFSKFARARAAILAGADLVIELPITTAVSSAEGFAFGGISLLNSLGVCSHISFGSESGSIDPLLGAAKALLSPDMDEKIKAELQTGKSYASARQAALKSKIGSGADIIGSPNNILAVEYIKALIKTGSLMEPVTVGRAGGDHDSSVGNSASAIRAKLLSDQNWTDCIPRPASEIFKEEIASGRGPVLLKTVESAVLYRLRRMDRDDYNALPGAGEGLGMRLMKNALSGTDIDNIIEKTKTKRYTVSRLRRMVLCAYLGITADDMGEKPAYVRVLGANARGCEILREMRSKCKLPCIMKSAQGVALSGDAGKIFARECRMNDLYALAYPKAERRAGGLDFTTSPYIDK